MARLKRRNTYQGLDLINVYIEDTSVNSPNYFRIFNLPEVFPAGKTAFLIDGSDNLVLGSEVKVEIIDSEGGVIYSEYPFYLEGTSRLVSVWVFEDTPVGTAKLTIVGQAKNVPDEWKNYINVRWSTIIKIDPTLPNDQPIRFYKQPKIYTREIRKPYLVRQYVGPQLVEYTTGTISGRISEDGSYNLRMGGGGAFNSLMSGGLLTVAPAIKDISPTVVLDVDAAVPTYSTYIKRIWNEISAYAVNPYFIYPDGTTLNYLNAYAQDADNARWPPQYVYEFADTPFTISYMNSASYVETENYRSFVELIISNMGTFSGDVKSVNLYMKSVGSIGNYEFVGDVVLEDTELLIDTASVTLDNRIGYFYTQSTIDNFWTASKFGEQAPASLTYTSAKILDAMHISGSLTGSSEYFLVYPTAQKMYFYENSEYTFKAILYGIKTLKQTYIPPTIQPGLYAERAAAVPVNQERAVLKIYLSGSAFAPKESETTENEFGKLVYELDLTDQTDAKEKAVILEKNFISDFSGSGSLLFKVEAGEWHVSDVSLKTSMETGFSPDVAYFYVPIPSWQRNDTIEFKTEFLDYNKRKSKTFSTSSETFVSGANFYIGGDDNLITGSFYVGSEIETGFQIAGSSGSLFKSVGYISYMSAAAGLAPAGFMIWSGSVQRQYTDEYDAVGLELHGGSGSAINPNSGIGETHALRFRTDTGRLEITGSIYATDGYFSGSLEANRIRVPVGGPYLAEITPEGYARFVSASIGGFNVTEDALWSDNFFISGTATGDDFFISTSIFNVKANGQVTGGAFLLDGGRITNNVTIEASLSADSIATPAGGPYKALITSDGYARFTSASIGGFNVDDNALWTTNFYISGTAVDNENFIYSPNFNVKASGDITGSQVLFTGGKIGGWDIYPTYLSSSNIRIDSAGTIQTSDFVSGLTGWRITSDFNGHAEFESARIRGALSTTAFIKETVNVVGGQLWVANATIISGTGVGATDTTWSVDNASGWAVGEIAVVKRFDNTGFATEYIRIESSSLDGDGRTTFNGKLYVERYYSSSIAWPDGYKDDIVSGTLVGDSGSDYAVTPLQYTPGQVIASTGLIGSGYIRLNANPRDYYSPYIDIVERTGSGIYDLSLKVRLGDLSGINPTELFGETNPGYGLYTQNGYFRGSIYADRGTIGGWTINSESLTGGNMMLSASGVISTSNFYVDEDGNLTASNAIITGSIYATDGYFDGTISASDGNIGGWTINADSLTAGNMMLSASGVISTSKFYVDEEGNMTASSAKISGSIYATDGYFDGTISASDGNIGGWTINADSLTAGNMMLSASGVISTSKFYVNENGEVTGGAFLFDGGRITNNVTIEASLSADSIMTPAGGPYLAMITSEGYARFVSASIGGFNVDDNAFWSDNFFISGTATGDEYFISSSNFNVKASGDITGSQVLFTGGKIGGWDIYPTYLSSSNIRIDSEGNLQTSDFVSGLQGWRITSDFNGHAEFESARIRGALSTTAFIKETVNVVGGQLWVANATIISGTGVGATDTTWSVDNASGWAVGEIAVVKRFDANGFFTEYIRIESSSLDGDGETSFNGKIYVERYYSASIAWPDGYKDDIVSGTLIGDSGSDSPSALVYSPGQVIASTGLSGSGYIRLNANPRDYYSPYIDIVERTGSGIYDLSLKVRLGDLSGINPTELFGETNPGYGLYTQNGFFRGSIYADRGTIGGWTINADSLTGGNMMLSASGVISTSKFYVDEAGNLTASNAVLTGSIHATDGYFDGTISASDGNIGGWTINADSLTGGNMMLSASGVISTSKFYVDEVGNLTASNAVLDNFVYQGANIFHYITVNSNNKEQYYYYVTGSVDGGGETRIFALLDLRSDVGTLGGSTAQFVRLNTAPTDPVDSDIVPIAGILLPRFGWNNKTVYGGRVVIEIASANIYFSAIYNSSDRTTIATNHPELDGFYSGPELCFYSGAMFGCIFHPGDLGDWYEKLFNQTTAIGGVSECDYTFTVLTNVGCRYDWVRGYFDYKLQSATAWDQVQVSVLSASSAYIGTLYGATTGSMIIISGTISGSIPYDQVFGYEPLNIPFFNNQLGTSSLATASDNSFIFDLGETHLHDELFVSGSGSFGYLRIAGDTIVTDNLIVSESASFGSVDIVGALNVGGVVTAKEFHTEYVSASIIYMSGSTKFGDSQDDTHEFTGSVNITGSLTVLGTTSITGSMFGTASWALSSSYVKAGTGSYWTGSTTGEISRQSLIQITGSLRVTGSGANNYFVGSARVGIGITNPSYSLHISGGVDPAPKIVTDYMGTRLIMESLGGIARLYSDTVNRLYIGNFYSNNLIALVDTNVGIGTTAPSAVLDVSGSTNFGYQPSTNRHQFSGSLFVSGSTKFGDHPATDRHQFTGSLKVTGSTELSVGELRITGSIYQTGSGVFLSDNNIQLSASTTISGTLTVTGYSASTTVFRVEGTSGSLFEVTDALTGSLFSVNDISGLTILEVFSDDRVVAGKFNSNALVVTASQVGIGTSIPSASLDVSGSTRIGHSSATHQFTGSLFDVSASTEFGYVGATHQFTGSLDVSGSSRFGRTIASHVHQFTGSILQTGSLGTCFIDNIQITGSLRVTGSGAHYISCGSVGIGTTNPAALFDVYGNTKFGYDLGHRHQITGSINQTGSGATSHFMDKIGIGLRSPLNMMLTISGTAVSYQGITGPEYATGFAGYGYAWVTQSTDQKWHLMTDHLTVRGTMNIYELLIHQIRATNGSVWVSNSGKIVSASLASDSTWYLFFDTGSGYGHTFLNGDIIRAQRWNADNNNLYQSDLRVIFVQSARVITASLNAGSTEPTGGMEYVRIGNEYTAESASRQGAIYLTADDTEAPYIDVIDGITTHSDFNTAGTIKVRMGKLTGFSDDDYGTLSGYGLYATGSVWLKGGIIATFGKIGGWHITSTYISASGQDAIIDSAYPKLAFGATANTMDINSGSTGVFISGSGDFRFGGISSGFIKFWNGNFSIDGANIDINATDFHLSSSGLEISSSDSSINLRNLIIISGSAIPIIKLNGGIISASNFYVSEYGDLTASNAYISGIISSSVGNIGGWTINAHSLTGGNMMLSASGVISNKSDEALFYVDEVGNLTASNAIITGSIYATDGYFDGTISASDGNIGGWTINADSLTGGNMMLSASGVISTSNFYVDEDGNLTASNAIITGSIYATDGYFDGTISSSDGNIGGWTISSNELYSNNIFLRVGPSDLGSDVSVISVGTSSQQHFELVAKSGTGAGATCYFQGFGSTGTNKLIDISLNTYDYGRISLYPTGGAGELLPNYPFTILSCGGVQSSLLGGAEGFYAGSPGYYIFRSSSLVVGSGFDLGFPDDSSVFSKWFFDRGYVSFIGKNFCVLNRNFYIDESTTPDSPASGNYVLYADAENTKVNIGGPLGIGESFSSINLLPTYLLHVSASLTGSTDYMTYFEAPNGAVIRTNATGSAMLEIRSPVEDLTTELADAPGIRIVNLSTNAGSICGIHFYSDTAFAGILGRRVGLNQEAIDFYTENTSRTVKMTIGHDGKVGIGTTGPNSTLDVRGPGQFTIVSASQYVTAPNNIRVLYNYVASATGITSDCGDPSTEWLAKYNSGAPYSKLAGTFLKTPGDKYLKVTGRFKLSSVALAVAYGYVRIAHKTMAGGTPAGYADQEITDATYATITAAVDISSLTDNTFYIWTVYMEGGYDEELSSLDAYMRRPIVYITSD